MQIVSDRLTLELVTVERAQAILDGNLDSVTAAPGWPHDGTRGGMWMAATRGAQIWLISLNDAVIGDGGTTGPADDAGAVKIGYGFADGYEEHRAEAVAAITAYALTQPGVTSVIDLAAEADNMIDHPVPDQDTGEHGTLYAFVRYLRECLVAKLDGLSDMDARRAGVDSGTSLLWLVKHCARVEQSWLESAFLGVDNTIVTFESLTDADTVTSVQSLYRRVGARSNEIVESHLNVEAEAVNAGFRATPVTLRWILIHLVEELGRHAGHADILREQIDGRVGR